MKERCCVRRKRICNKNTAFIYFISSLPQSAQPFWLYFVAPITSDSEVTATVKQRTMQSNTPLKWIIQSVCCFLRPCLTSFEEPDQLQSVSAPCYGQGRLRKFTSEWTCKTTNRKHEKIQIFLWLSVCSKQMGTKKQSIPSAIAPSCLVSISARKKKPSLE